MKCRVFKNLGFSLGFAIFGMSIILADDYTESEFSFLEGAGPWPPQIALDPVNRFMGNPKVIELGEYLFREKRLSRSGAVSCATCHDPENFYTDGLSLSVGVSDTRRNSPTVVNTTFQRWFGWDGSSDSLWSQSMRPILSEVEMNSDGAVLRGLYEDDDDFRLAFTEILSKAPETVDDEGIMVFTSKALASYQHTLISERSAFDRYRFAVINNTPIDRAEFPLEATAGAKLFFGSAKCALCHLGALFTNNEFASIGLPHIDNHGKVDKGRFSGITAVLSSPYNRLGAFSDDDSNQQSARTQYLRQRHDSFGEFKVPSLRGVVNTAPYMHDGSMLSLRDVVVHYSTINLDRIHSNGESLLKPLNLTESQISSLVAFLETL